MNAQQLTSSSDADIGEVAAAEEMTFSVRHSPNVGKLVDALAKAQLEFKPVIKDKKNPYYSSVYADLAGVIAATQPALAKNGLVVTQFPHTTEGQTVGLTTFLAHSSDQWMAADWVLPATMKGKDGTLRFDAQSEGSAITYARRYSYQALVGVASEDDDGNRAAGLKNEGLLHEKKFQSVIDKAENQKPIPDELEVNQSDLAETLQQSIDQIQDKHQDGILRTKQVEAVEDATNAAGKPFLKLTYQPLMGLAGGKSRYCNCFDPKLFAAVRESQGRPACFKVVDKTVKGKTFVNVVDVLEIDGLNYKDGKLAEA